MFGIDFYPTPADLADRMACMVNIDNINSVLEPSAGDGRLAEAIAKQMNAKRYRYSSSGQPIDFENLDIDAIELSPELGSVLKGKGIRLVHDDFLKFSTFKRYDLIIMNPPFSDGAKHLLKALEMQQNGGKIVCILNAETLKNPCTNDRRALQQQLTDLNAKVEFIQNAFVDADRKTSVEIALIFVDIENKKPHSNIFENLRKAQENQPEQSNENEYGAMVDSDYIRAIVQQYNFEVQAGLRFLEEYEAMRPYILDRFKHKDDQYDFSKPILSLEIEGKSYDKTASPNRFLKCVRAKYWTAYFNRPQVTQKMTTSLIEEYQSNVEQMADYDFSLYNIYQIRCDMNARMIQGVEETILNLFEELSNKHHWFDECSKNIHYYNGWKTNTAYKINKKVIIPLAAYSDLWGRFEYDYKVHRKLSDIEKVFNYLDGGLTESRDLQRALKVAQAHGMTKKIDCKYFQISLYKKGTCHIEFKNLDLLEKFNIFGSQRKGWLPPFYGKKQYKDMTADEKVVIDNFQGETAYSKTMQNKDYFLFDANNTLMLEAGQESA